MGYLLTLVIRPGRSLWDRLVEPPATIKEPDCRHQSRLLASLLLALIVIGVLLTLIWVLAFPNFKVLPVLVGALALLLVVYSLNRAGYYHPASILTITVASISPFALVLTANTGDDRALAFLLLSVLLASMFLSLRAIVVVAAANVLGMLVLRALIPAFGAESNLTPLNLNIVGSALIFVAAHHRNLLEKDRLSVQKQNEIQLRYQADLLQQVSDAVISTDKDFIIRSWNKAAETIFGWKAEEVIGKPASQFIQTQYPGARREDVIAQFLEQGYWRGEVIQPARDGRPIYMLASGTVLKDHAGNPIGSVSVNRDITQRKKAETLLRESEARYRKISELTSDYAYAFRLDLGAEPVLEWVTEAFTRVTGFSVDEIRTLADWDRTAHPDDVEILREERRKLFARQKPGEFQFRIITRDGEVRWLSNHLVAEWDEDQVRIVWLYGAARDITERKQIEDALRASETKYRLLIEQAADGIFICDQKGNYLEVNSRGCQMLGYSRDELLQLNVWDIVLEAEAALAPSRIDQLRSGKILLSERLMRRKDGTIFPTESTARLLVDGTIQAIVRDITERKRAEEMSQQSEKRFRALVENSSDAIALFGADGTILYGSPSTTALLGYRLDVFVGRNAFELIHEEDHEFVTSCLTQSLQQPGQGVRVQARVLHQDGTWRWLEGIFTNLLDDPNIRAIVNNYRDVTERKLAEETLRGNEERYRIISEMMGDYVYSVRVLPGDEYKTAVEWVAGAIEKITGHTAEEALAGINWGELIHPEDVPIVNARRQVLLSGKKDISEFRMINKRGEMYWLRAYNQPIWDEVEGRVVRIYAAVQDITEHKQAEALLQQSEQRLRTVLENMPVMLDVFDANSNIIVWNRECERVTGYSREEIVGNSGAMDLLYPDPAYREQMLAQWTARGNNYRNWEWEVVAKDGTVKTIAWSNISSQLRVPGWDSWGIGVDVTDRVQAQEALQKINDELEMRVEERTAELSEANMLLSWEVSERKLVESRLAEERNLLRILIDNLPDYIYVKDTETKFVTVNHALLEFAGLQTPDQMIGKTDFDLGPSEFAETFYADDLRVLAGNPVINHEVVDVDPAGQVKWHSTTKVPLRDLSGQLVGLVGISRDITERKQFEEALAQERNLLRTVIDLMPDTVFVKDRESRFLLANRSVTEIMGAASSGELLGKNDFDYYAPDIAQPFFDDEQQVIRSEQPMINKTEYNINQEGIERWYLTTKVPLRNNHGDCIGIVGVGRDITEHKQIEEKLAQERNLLRTLIDHLPDQIFVKDAESRFVIANPSVLHDMGVASLDELVGKTDLDFFPVEAAKQYLEEEQAVMRSGQPLLNQEHPIVWPGGTAGWLSTTKVPLRSPGNTIIGIVGINHDITERKQAEEERRQLEERTRLTIDGAYEAFIAIDDSGAITDWNRQAEAIFGWSRQEALGQLLADTIIPQQYREAHQQGMQHFLATGNGPVLNKRIEITAVHRNRREFPVELTITPIQWGGSYIFSAFLHDISERKEIEAKLQYQAYLLANVNDAVIASDNHFILTSWNPAAEEMYGWKAEEVLGKSWLEIVRSEYVGTSRSEVVQALLGTGRIHTELIIYRKDDRPIHVESDVIALKDDTGVTTGYLSVNRDITERKRAEDEIKKLNADLEHRAAELEAANKELEAFSYSVSHDLRAPLRAMDGFSRILLDDYAAQLDADAQRYLNLVRDNSQQMGELINGLLNFSRLGRQALQKKTVNPKDLIERIMQDLLPEGEDRKIELYLGELPLCQADPILLKQVFANLLQNALKFTRQRDLPQVEVSSQDMEGARVYYVKDNGVGFDMRYAHKLFGVFQRMHRAEEFEGVGVGLATVQRIVHRHGGRIWAESELGKGATFYFTLGGEDGRE